MSNSKWRAVTTICRWMLPVGCFVVTGALVPVVRAQNKTGTPPHSSSSRVLLGGVERVVFESSAFHGQNIPSPYSDKGYLISRRVETFGPETPNVMLYDKRGQRVREAVIWFPQSTRVAITSAAVTSDGRIVASGEADKVDGTRAAFIALTDLSGKVRNVIQTKDFYPRNVCVAPDDTVWSFGGTWWDKENDRPLPGEILRQFDFGKGQVAAYIPRSTFHDNSQYDSLTDMRCSSSEVAILSHSENTYIVMPYGSPTPRIYEASPPPSFSMSGFAIFGPGRAYTVLTNQERKDDPAQGLYSLDLDETTRTVRWVAVKGAVGSRTTASTVLRLWGTDGEYLVLGRAQDPSGLVALHWAAVGEE